SHLHAGLLHAAHHFDRLVGRDAAADSERDLHDFSASLRGTSQAINPCSTSLIAMWAGLVDFVLILGFALFWSCLARSAAMMMKRNLDPIDSGILCIHASKRSHDVLSRLRPGRHAAAVRQDDRLELFRRAAEVLVDDQEIV